MDLKLAAVCLAVIVVVSAAPKSIASEKELINSFAKFLEQDNEVAELLHKADLLTGNALHHLSKRQADENGVLDVDDSIDQLPEQPKEGGFFDRAAKFVMEVLQRFLKWINSDN